MSYNTTDPLLALTMVLSEMQVSENDFTISEAYASLAEIILRSFKDAGFTVEPADPYLRKARAEQDISVLEIARASGLAVKGVNAKEPNPNGRAG